MDLPLKIVLVRHSITAGNLAAQYIGSTDQPLCPEGVKLARCAAQSMPQVDRIYRSPILRCRQTAALLYPDQISREIADLREADFGICEGKTYAELAADPAYQEWITSSGALPPPGGESAALFSKRCVAAFCSVLYEMAHDNISCAACIIHGGSIMAIMTALASPKRHFYDWQVDNCCGFIVNADPQSGKLILLEKIRVNCEV